MSPPASKDVLYCSPLDGFEFISNAQAAKIRPNRSRQLVACDGCRALKKRCSGNSPCERCQDAGSICTYTSVKPNKKRRLVNSISNTDDSDSSPPTPVPHSPINADIAKDIVERKLMRVYFERICFMEKYFFMDIDRFCSESPSPAVLLQRASAMATVARSFGIRDGPNSYLRYEKQARQLASDLFDEFTADSALGFFMLSFHMWGENLALAGHYRDLGVSIGRRVQSIHAKDHLTVEQMLRMQVTAVGYIASSSVGPNQDYHDLVQELRDHSAQTEGLARPSGDTLSVDHLIFLISFYHRFSYLFHDPEHLDFNRQPLRQPVNMGRIQEELPFAMSTFEMMTEVHFVPSNQMDVVKGVYHIIKACLHWAANQADLALNSLRESIPILESPANADLVPFFSPIVSEMAHFGFLIAFESRDVLLANQLVGFERRLAAIHPRLRPLMEQDMALLKTLRGTSAELFGTFDFPAFPDQSRVVEVPPISSHAKDGSPPKTSDNSPSLNSDSPFHWF